MLLRVKLVTLITLKILASSVVLIIMQDDATTTGTTPSQKRETPEDADTGHTAQEPERRVRPRETPVGAPAAAAPEPEEGASAEAQSEGSNNGDDADEEGDTVAAPRTAVRYWQIRGPSAAQRARWGPGNPFWDPDSEEETAPRIFGSTPIDDNTPPDPWVREEFEVETGRVVHQETIEGEPPRRCCNH